MEEINVNLIPSKMPATCHVSQYDIGRQIKINLYCGDEVYELPDPFEYKVKLKVRKPDGTYNATLSIDFEEGDTSVIITTTQQMCAVAGTNICELRIEEDGYGIGTANFNMKVERDPLDGAVQSQSEIVVVGNVSADNITYDNTTSQLTATNVQDALDEVAAGGGGGGGSSTLAGLSDTTIVSPANDEFLVYDGTASKWKNKKKMLMVEVTESVGVYSFSATAQTVYDFYSNDGIVILLFEDEQYRVNKVTKSGSDYTILSSLLSINAGVYFAKGLTWTYTNSTGNNNVYTGSKQIKFDAAVAGTLTAGSTSITLSSLSIHTSSTIDIYTDVYGVNPTAVSVSEGSITLTFEEQSNDISVKVRIS